MCCRWTRSWTRLACWRLRRRGPVTSPGVRGSGCPSPWSWSTTRPSCSLMSPPGLYSCVTWNYTTYTVILGNCSCSLMSPPGLYHCVPWDYPTYTVILGNCSCSLMSPPGLFPCVPWDYPTYTVILGNHYFLWEYYTYSLLLIFFDFLGSSFAHILTTPLTNYKKNLAHEKWPVKN